MDPGGKCVYLYGLFLVTLDRRQGRHPTTIRFTDQEVIPMFARECTECGKRMLVFPSQILGLKNTGIDVELTYECWCGAAQTCHMDPKGNLVLAA